MHTRLFATIASTAAVLAATCALPSAASADALSVSLLAKGVGTTYAASSGTPGDYANNLNTNQVTVSKAVGLGASGTFTTRIKNTGSSTTQYLVYWGMPYTYNAPFPPFDPTQQILPRLYTGGELFTHNKNITFAAQEDGYVTDPIAPGKFQTFIIRIKMPGTNAFDNSRTLPGEYVDAFMHVFPSDATKETQTLAASRYVAVPRLRGEPWADTANVGTSGFVPVGTTQVNQAYDFDLPTWIAGAPLAPGKVITFAAAVTNRSSATVTEHLTIAHDPSLLQPGCAASFPFAASVGTTPVPGLQNPAVGYSPVLAPNKSVTVKIKVTVPTNVPATCNQSTLDLNVDYAGNTTVKPQVFHLISSVART